MFQVFEIFVDHYRIENDAFFLTLFKGRLGNLYAAITVAIKTINAYYLPLVENGRNITA